MAIFDLQQESGQQTTNTVTQQNQNQTGATTQQGTQQNMFTPDQLAVQGQLGQHASNLLQGKFGPQWMQPNDAVSEWANFNFNRYELPRIYQKHGPGSPVAEGRRQEMNLGLAAQAAQNAQQGSLSAFNDVWRYALTPTGSNTDQAGTSQAQTTNATNQQQQQTWNRDINKLDVGGLLEIALPTLAGIFPGIF